MIYYLDDYETSWELVFKEKTDAVSSSVGFSYGVQDGDRMKMALTTKAITTTFQPTISLNGVLPTASNQQYWFATSGAIVQGQSRTSNTAIGAAVNYSMVHWLDLTFSNNSGNVNMAVHQLMTRKTGTTVQLYGMATDWTYSGVSFPVNTWSIGGAGGQLDANSTITIWKEIR